MKKQTPFMDFYNRCMSTGWMTNVHPDLTGNGLCYSPIRSKYTFKMFAESANDEGMQGYWGYDGGETMDWDIPKGGKSEFTPFRQTVVLFCAAINGEL